MDGLDGLVSGCMAIAISALILMNARYLISGANWVPFRILVLELSPAKVFMGM